MTPTSPNEVTWHPETLAASTDAALRLMRDQALLGGVYLAGGTGFSLRFGHRISVDLDFFSPDLFDEEILLQRIQNLSGFSLVTKSSHTLHAVIQETKVSFLGYAYPLLFPAVPFQGVPVADPRDIACMKISAVAGRGTKRDFVDFYVACREYGLRELLQLFAQKFEQTSYNQIHVLKSLMFFQDAEKDPMPHMLIPLDWDEVKSYFRREVPALL
jgi:hypothetical protein